MGEWPKRRKVKVIISRQTFLDSSSMLALVQILVGALLLGVSPASAALLGPEQSAPIIENNVGGLTIGVSNQSSSLPIYWRRPGCYRVGHTRTISIPGCVKFNISTNACRGYCMSFSIPSNEDIGPFEHLELELETTTAGADNLGAQVPIGNPDYQHGMGSRGERHRRALGWLLNDRAPRKRPDSREEFLLVPTQVQSAAAASTRATPHRSRTEISAPPAEPTQPAVLKEPLEGLGKLTMDSGLVDAIMGNIADGKRREVVSVSQCCNMMEAEEVLVNVRCGVNEVRQLVFKSAKSCECFFCKHV